MQPSPLHRRVGIRIATFEACSGFTHVTARQLAQPPKATFVTGLQPTDYADKLSQATGFSKISATHDRYFPCIIFDKHHCRWMKIPPNWVTVT
jgi:hypothetical protein